MNQNRARRQVYNKKALQQISQRQKTLTRNTQRKPNVAKQIFNEIKKDIDIKNEEEGQQEEQKNEPQTQEVLQSQVNTQEQNEEKKKIIKTRKILDDKTLLYEENGLRKYYETITSASFSSKDNEKNLNKLVGLYRNWHFMFFRDYDMNFFTDKLIDLGKKSSVRGYMSRLRKIYKGLESWDIMYDEQQAILGKNSGTQVQKSSVNPTAQPATQKIKAEAQLKNPNINVIESKMNDVKIKQDNKSSQNGFEDLILDNLDGQDEENKKEKIETNIKNEIKEDDLEPFEEKKDNTIKNKLKKKLKKEEESNIKPDIKSEEEIGEGEEDYLEKDKDDFLNTIKKDLEQNLDNSKSVENILISKKKRPFSEVYKGNPKDKEAGEKTFSLKKFRMQKQE